MKQFDDLGVRNQHFHKKLLSLFRDELLDDVGSFLFEALPSEVSVNHILPAFFFMDEV